MQRHKSWACEPYAVQSGTWPGTGRHILAQFDEQHLVVYQAYRPSIGREASANLRFGSQFSLNRMSWIKPGFLWMMYRSGWATKVDQEVILAVWLPRSAFDELLAQAVPSHFEPQLYPDEARWRKAISDSDVRLQWDPDHDPDGRPLARRAVQIGLRGDILRRYAHEWPADIQDVTAFVHDQRALVQSNRLDLLQTLREAIYPVNDLVVAHRIGVDNR
jgi:hypothetical protein